MLGDTYYNYHKIFMLIVHLGVLKIGTKQRHVELTL